MAAKDLPEGAAPAQQPDPARRERHPPGTQREGIGALLGAGGGQIGGKGVRVPVNEIEDSVAPGIQAGDEAGPGHRTLRRNAGPEGAEVVLGHEAAEVGHPALLDEPPQQARVHAVDSQHDHFIGSGCSGGRAGLAAG